MIHVVCLIETLREILTKKRFYYIINNQEDWLSVLLKNCAQGLLLSKSYFPKIFCEVGNLKCYLDVVFTKRILKGILCF